MVRGADPSDLFLVSSAAWHDRHSRVLDGRRTVRGTQREALPKRQMEAIDAAFETFNRIVEAELPGYDDSIVSEADVRMKVIDRMFVEVLGWPLADIHLESPAGDGFVDYRCTIAGLNRLVIEAKRKNRSLGITPDRSARAFRLNGPVFQSSDIDEGIEQAIRYCGHKNAELACVTNGQQWVIFLGNRRGDGRDTLEGYGIVFGSLAGVKAHFKEFYDLLSWDAVRAYRYRATFQEAEGQPVRTNDFEAPVRKPESRQLLPADKLYADVDRVMLSFFRDLSGDDDPELRRRCFVESRESTAAEERLARISEDLRNRIRTLHGDGGQAIADAIRRVQEMQRREFVLLVGTKGAGKSTFIERFFDDVLPSEIARDCVLVRIDLADCGADESSITQWLDQHFSEGLERAVFGDRVPTFDELQGVYWREYERWREGPYKPLYESDRTAFKIAFGQHIDQRREERPHEHIVHVLHRIVASEKKVPCLVFDNADHFTIEFQERVFQYAHSLYSAVLCLVLVPITDKTSWQLSRQGALESFFTESFFLPTPAPELVLRKRIDFIEARLNEPAPPQPGRGYFVGRGIGLAIDDLRAFTNTLQAVFIRTGHTASWIGNLANGDIRRSLQLTRELVASPYVQVPELLKAYLADTSVVVNDEDTRLALIRGKYDIYPSGQSAFVQNVFALTTEVDTTPLLALRILQVLGDARFQEPDGEARYLDIERLTDYFAAMNIEPRATRVWLEAMLRCGLILSYDPTVVGIERVTRIELAPAGDQHLAWAQRDWVYLEAMAEVTPLIDRTTHDTLRVYFESALPHSRRMVVSTFVEYLVREDGKRCLVPDHAMYDGQRRLSEELQQTLRSMAQSIGVAESARFGRLQGAIVSWNSEKGFGFIGTEGGGPNVFVHISDVLNGESDRLPVGAVVEYDVTVSDKGPRASRIVVIR